ncbi:MAG: ABC transporter permease [Pirellulales bacterium]|nr:ABC transporter permease [Pirellulales bacterium]
MIVSGRKPTRNVENRAIAGRSDRGFRLALALIGGIYVLSLVAMLAADLAYLSMPADAAESAKTGFWRPAIRACDALAVAFADPNIRYSFKLTMISCLFTAILSVMVAVPLGYGLSRYRFWGRNFIDAILDIPIVLPPLVVGLSLLILFQFWPWSLISKHVVFQIPAVVLAQFMVAAAFAVRIMRAGFDQIDTRLEQVALTLGCSQSQAFSRVVLPQAKQSMLTAGTIAWARSLGEFGPLLVFAGATRMKTEVLSTTVFLELSIGNLRSAVAVSILMVLAAIVVLIVARRWGTRDLSI